MKKRYAGSFLLIGCLLVLLFWWNVASGSVEISVPDEYMGDIMGDLNKRRGRILGMEQNDGRQLIIAEVPQAEMFKYATDLRSMTQAKGSFKMSFERYEEVPQAIAAKIIEAHKADLADDDE